VYCIGALVAQIRGWGNAMKNLMFVILFWLAAPSVVWAAQCEVPKITIDAENLSNGEEEDFAKVLRAAIAKVCKWWGPTYTGPFKITISDSRGPSMSLLPAWRGKRGSMLFRSRPTTAGRTAITHEVVHVFAPNGNRFLAEGLAVFAHEYLGGRSAYPAFDYELHQAAKRHLESVDLSEMDSLALPERLRTEKIDETQAYFVAGSFIKFLISTHGMEKFRRLYAMTPMVPRSKNQAGSPERWREVYGVDLKTLEKAWKAKLGS